MASLGMRGSETTRLGGCSSSGRQQAACHPVHVSARKARRHPSSQPSRSPSALRAAVQDDLDLADGWAVEVSTPKTPQAKAARKAKQQQPQQRQQTGASTSQVEEAAGAGRSSRGSRFADINSANGKMSLSILKEHLQRAEQGQDVSAALPRGIKLGQQTGLAKPPPKSRPAARRQVVVYEDDDGNTWSPADEDEEVTDDGGPEFELNLLDDEMEYVEYDGSGRVASRSTASGRGTRQQRPGQADDSDDDSDDEFDFTGASDSGWKALAAAVAADIEEEVAEGAAQGKGAKAATGAAAKSGGRAASASGTAALSSLPSPAKRGGAKGAAGAGAGAKGAGRGQEALLMGDDDEDDEYWGVEELAPGVGGNGGPQYRSLLEELGVVKGKGGAKGVERGVDEELGVHVAWGGNASSSAVDLDEQERLLSRMFKPHKVAKLMEQQREALQQMEQIKRNAGAGTESKLHRQLRIVAGTASNKRLLSSRGPQTRPMMEKVRMAIFNMIQAQAGTVNCLPERARWLDLFAGTGSVGLEALSRGVRESHFVEMDPWVTKNVLGKNITTCGFNKKSVVHTTKAEDFLRRAVELPSFAGGSFDFISMCPPYLLVSYPELFDLLVKGQLLHPGTILFVEYPKQLSHQVPATLGPLVQVRKRKYGRTHVVVYGPPGAEGEDDERDVEGQEDF